MANCNKCGQPFPVVKCQHCEKEFERNRKDKKFCSSNCKVYAHYEKHGRKGKK